MSPNQPRGPASTSTSSTRPVYLAAAELRAALALPEEERSARVREAKEWLLSAADAHGRETAAVRQQYFEAPPSSSAKAVSSADALAGIMADAQVGNTLIAAGKALGEEGAPANPGALDDALMRMQSGPEFRAATAAVQHFEAAKAHSATISDAIQTFSQRVDETLKSLVSQAHEAGEVVEKLSQVDAAEALEALSQLGGPLAKLPEFGVFIKKGVEKLRGAMQSLIALLGQAGLNQVKDQITKFWSKITDGTLVDSLLGWAFDQQPIEEALTRAKAKTGLAIEAVDSASDLLPSLADGYKAKMSWARILSTTVGSAAAALLTFSIATAGTLAEFTAGAYLLILAAIVVIGRDYAGEEGFFHRGKGILGVVKSL